MTDRFFSLAALTEDEQLLAAHWEDLARRSEQGCTVSGFLNRRQQRICLAAASRGGWSDRLFFWGGAAGAERRCAVMMPPWTETAFPAGSMLEEERETQLIALLKEEADGGEVARHTLPLLLAGSGFRTLEHRDWLGALLATGIRREVLGDLILLSDSRAVTFADERIAGFLEKEFSRAGADAVSVSAGELPAGFRIVREYRAVSGTVSSPRLDAAVHVLTGLSREKAAELIRAGLVTLDDFVCDRVDRTVEAGSVLTARGFGKFRIDAAEEMTKKGRIRLEARKYL